MRYILNSAVMTSFGEYIYSPITIEEAKEWVKSEFTSAIGYKETATVLSRLLNKKIRKNRITIKMEPGDEALVFRIILPPGSKRLDPTDKKTISETIEKQHFELGLLKRIK